jgi:hypothetical protein
MVCHLQKIMGITWKTDQPDAEQKSQTIASVDIFKLYRMYLEFYYSV